jgi:tyrosine decarboxylase/aspartate 1-decarboxylase
MREKGLTKKEIQARLETASGKDLRYRDGKIFNSMCTSPHVVAKRAHCMFLEANLGDPGLFPGCAQLEREAISALTALLHGPKESDGFIVSGGTEANLLAMYAAREAAKVEKPEIVIPESAHFSFEKTCNMLKLKAVKARLDDSFRTDSTSAETKVTKNTVAIVGNAGSPELGTVDPINELSEIALKHGIPLHVDAAFGGLVLPFLKDLGAHVPDFDFSLPGVQSITVDPHKMGMSTIPAGGILFRDQKSLECIKVQTPYLTADWQTTFVGTRSGASAAATWAVFEKLGREGFRKTVKHCMKLTNYLSKGIQEAGCELVTQPTMNIVAFRKGSNAKLIKERLQQRGYFVSFIPRLNCIRVVVMPHHNQNHIEDFLKTLTTI